MAASGKLVPAAHVEAGLAEFVAFLDPGQHFVNGFLVADADVPLHLIHVIAIAVDAIPAIKSCRFEITLDDLFFVLFYFKRLFRCHDRKKIFTMLTLDIALLV